MRKKNIFTVRYFLILVIFLTINSIMVRTLYLHKSSSVPTIVSDSVRLTHTVIWRWFEAVSRKNIDSQAISSVLIWNPRRSNSGITEEFQTKLHRGEICKFLKSEILIQHWAFWGLSPWLSWILSVMYSKDHSPCH